MTQAMTDFLFDGPSEAPATVLLAHGAGGAIDSSGMNAFAAALAGAGLRVARFEFAYMAARRGGRRIRIPHPASRVHSGTSQPA